MLSEQELLDILESWSFWGGDAPQEKINRNIRLPKKLSDDLVLIIQGVRRGGKSTLLTQLPRHYQLDLEHCYYCNFEDPRLMNELNHELLSAIVKLARKKIPAKQACYFFFDEIQHVLAWEKWLHTQLERPKNNYFVVTGSNSFLLSGEYGTALTGRHVSLELFPFSYQEYLEVFPKKKIDSYLVSGGFPRPLTHEAPEKLLQEYFNDIVLRDVLRRVSARSPDPIKQVAKMAFDTCGSQLSYRKIAAVTQLSVDTVQLYLQACEEAYLLFSCPFFAFSEKKRSSRHKKFYPIDPGLRAAITTNATPDLGKSLETCVFLRLKQTVEDVYFWEAPHGGEVDFVTVEGQVITPYQVTWNEKQPRHEKALEAFYEAFPQANEAVFVTRENARDYC
jgi:predicted AAA+ superfamily ATPase